MRLPLLLALALSPSLLFAPGPSGTAGASTGNLLGNGGFELDQDLDLMPDGWTLLGVESVARYDAALPKEGLKALQLASAHPERPLGLVADPTPPPVVGVLSDPVAVTPGAHLVLSAWVRLHATTPTQGSVQPPNSTVGLDMEGLPTPRPHVSYEIPKATEWTLVEVPVVVPYGVESVRVRFDLRGPAAYRVDDVRLVQVPFDGNWLLNPDFETGHHRYMPDLWDVPCGKQMGVWTTEVTKGHHSLYFQRGFWPDCSPAVTPPFVLEAGRYVLSGDRYFPRSSGATVEVLAFGPDGRVGGDEPPLMRFRRDLAPVDRLLREVMGFCAPEGTVKAQVLLHGPPGAFPLFWDDMRLERVGDCP